MVAAYAYKNGDPERLILPTDSMNRKCGVDSSVIDKPYLVFLDLTKCVNLVTPINGCPTTQVCVEQCPQENFLLSSIREDEFNSVRHKMICDLDVIVDKLDFKKAQAMAKENRCAEWYLKSEPSE